MANGLPFTYRRAISRALLALYDQELVLDDDKPGNIRYWTKIPGASGMAANAIIAIMRPDEALALHLCGPGAQVSHRAWNGQYNGAMNTTTAGDHSAITEPIFQ